MSELGKLIVFEGPDGAGKTTLASLLVKTLQADGVDCEYHSFPGRSQGTLGQLVYDVHHEPERFGVESISPASVQVLHIAAHLEAIERRILPALASGRWIVLDRFWWSTWVYGLIYGVQRNSLEAMINLELIHWQGVVPTIAFLIMAETPMRDSITSSEWNDLCRIYHELIEKERNRHDIQIIRNNAPLDDIVAQLHHAVTRRSNGPFE